MNIQEVWKSESALSDEFCDNLVRLGKETNHEYGFVDKDTLNTNALFLPIKKLVGTLTYTQ